MSHPTAVLVCPCCKAKPDPVFAQIPLEQFLRTHVMLAFPYGDEGHTEGCWVYVTEIGTTDPPSDEVELIGFLNQDPVHPIGFVDRDWIGFRREEICRWDRGGTPREA